MNAEALFTALAENAWKLAAKSMLDENDIRQELYLMCMEVAEGRSAYNPVIGGVHEYIMGRLWGLIRRWERPLAMEYFTDLTVIGDDVDDHSFAKIEAGSALMGMQALSVEDVLLHRQEMLDQDVADVEERMAMQQDQRHLSTLVILMQKGHWSVREAAQFCGMSAMGMQYRIKPKKNQKPRAVSPIPTGCNGLSAGAHVTNG